MSERSKVQVQVSPPYIMGTPNFLHERCWSHFVKLFYCSKFCQFPRICHNSYTGKFRPKQNLTQNSKQFRCGSNNTNSIWWHYWGLKELKMIFFYLKYAKISFRQLPDLTMNWSNNTVADELIIGILKHCCLQYCAWPSLLGRGTTPTFCYFKHSVE